MPIGFAPVRQGARAPTAARRTIVRRAVSAPPSRPRPLAALIELDRAVGNGEAEGRPDGAVDQPDLAAVGAHQFGRDGEPEPALPVRVEPWNASNKCARARPSSPGPVSDTSITTTAPSRRPVMRTWSRPGSRAARLSSACTALRARLSRIRNSCSWIGVDHEPALDRADPADLPAGVEAERLAHLLDQPARARSPAGRAAPPARGHRTRSTGRTRWRARARSSAWARNAGRADRSRSPAAPRTAAPR